MAPEVAPTALKPSLMRMDGFSARLIDEHYNILYKGYVNKLNEIRSKLELASRGAASPTYSELRSLKVEEGFALNAVRLHEWYFGNLGGSIGEPREPLASAIERDFGTWELWLEDFKAAAALARGWAILALDLGDGRLHNYVADSHSAQGVWSAVPVLVLDTYEHAYALDYGARRAPYVEAFLRNVDWGATATRLERAISLVDTAPGKASAAGEA